MPKDKIFDAPAGAMAKVRLIDTTSKISELPLGSLSKPLMSGFSHYPTIPSWSFLVESSTGKKALFDLGIRKDWENMPPKVVQRLKGSGWKIEAEQNVADILVEHQVRLEDIESVIWSHWHWDHVGDPSTFPTTTELVVGPGFKKAFAPGYPAREDAPVLETDFQGRNLRELDFQEGQALDFWNMKAFDFFGDGSFYLLDTPGHAIGHLAGLARTTTNPDTFIFMGGDVCHHGGEIRPSPYNPLPKEINPHPLASYRPNMCPGALFEDLLEERGRKGQAFFDLAMGHDIPQATHTLHKVQEADAHENVFFISAHDDTLWGVVDVFPKSVNDWKERGWRKEVYWTFLRDFEHAFDALDQIKWKI